MCTPFQEYCNQLRTSSILIKTFWPWDQCTVLLFLSITRSCVADFLEASFFFFRLFFLLLSINCYLCSFFRSRIRRFHRRSKECRWSFVPHICVIFLFVESIFNSSRDISSTCIQCFTTADWLQVTISVSSQTKSKANQHVTKNNHFLLKLNLFRESIWTFQHVCDIFFNLNTHTQWEKNAVVIENKIANKILTWNRRVIKSLLITRNCLSV